MLNVQDILANLPAFLAGADNLAGVFAAIIGGICALKGIGYLETLRQKKAVATFSFGAQLYARLYEIRILLEDDERLFTNLYSDTARREWEDKRGASTTELNHFYNCAQETLEFIKTAPDQMPAYKDWVADYANLIQFLVDILHFDIRDSQHSFKFDKMCDIGHRTALCKSICAMLDRMMRGIKDDQNSTAEELFCNEVIEVDSVPQDKLVSQ